MPRSSQPSDLKSPIPGVAQKEEVAGEIAAAKGVPMEAPAAAAPGVSPSEAPVDPADLGGFQQLAGSDAGDQAVAAGMHPSDEDLFSQLAKDETTVQQMTPGFEQAGAGDERPLGMMQELRARFIQGFGRKPEQEASLLQKALGDGFEVQPKDGKVFFRKKGSKKFFPIDREAFSGGLAEALGDVADLSGMALDVGASIGTEALSIAGGTLAAPGPGTIAGAIAGVPASAAASVAAREAAIRYFDGDPTTSPELKNEFLWGTGLNAVTLGAGAMLKGFGRKALDGLEDFVKKSPMTQVKQLADVRQSFEEVSTQILGKNRPGELGTEAVGEAANDALSLVRGDLDKKMQFARRESVMRSGGKPMDTQNYAQALSKQLTQLGIDPQTQPLLKDPEVRAHILEQIRKSKAFGGDTGVNFVEKVMDEYEQVSKSGGLRMDEIWNTLDHWKQTSGYKTGAKIEFPKATQAVSRELRGALAEDRDQIIAKMYQGADNLEGEFIKDSIQEYAQKRDSIVRFQKLFKSKKEANEKFAEALIQPNDAKAIRDVKTLLGPNSNEFEMLRAEWFDRVFRDSIDSSSGIVQPGKLRDVMDTYGDSVLNELMTPVQKQSINHMINKAEKIIPMDLAQSGDQGKNMVKELVVMSAYSFRNPGASARFLYNILRWNADAAKYLQDDGLLQVATSMKDPVAASKIVKFSQFWKRIMDSTDVVKKGDKNILVPIDIAEKIKDPEVLKTIQRTQEMLGSQPNVIRLPGAGAFSASEGMHEMERR